MKGKTITVILILVILLSNNIVVSKSIAITDTSFIFLPILVQPQTPDYQIAFSSSRDGSFDLYTMRADGTHTLQLTDDEPGEYSIAWSPDGKKLLYTTSVFINDPPFIQYSNSVMNLETGATQPINFNPNQITNPDWSPDGTKIAFSGTPHNGSPEDGHPGIYVMNADGQNSLRISPYGENSTTPRWSHDGNWIVYVAEDENGRWIKKMRPDGTQPAALTDYVSEAMYPAWSPDNNSVIYAKYTTNPKYCIYNIQVNTLQQTQVWCTDFSILAMDWARDGDRILLTLATITSSSLYVLHLSSNTAVPVTNGTYDFEAVWSPVKLP